MIQRITITERGATPRRLVKVYNASSKVAWRDAATQFHAEFRDERFTNEHAAKAGYKKRKGEAMPEGSKAFRKSYTGRKFRQFGHTRPLEFTGDSRQAAKSANVTSTSKSARLVYPGLRTLNFRHPKSQINMREEFNILLQSEITALATTYDTSLSVHLNADNGSETRTV